jgi:NAD(P)-dependent dehydrogenase (short-subunit alcohol dehydrogenase family)
VRCLAADIDAANAEATAELAREAGVEAAAARVDVTDAASLEELAEAAYARFGSVHLLCNNAGVGAMARVDAIADGDWSWVLSVNLGGVYNGVRAFVPRMREQGAPAHILNTASEHGVGLPFGGMGVYTASKHAVVGLSDVMRRDYADEGIGVSVLCPGWVNTAIWNCQRYRQERFGGAVELSPETGRLWQERGMDPLEVGRIAVEGVERGDFFIMTHPEVRQIAEMRYRELMEAFDRLDARRGA